MNARVLTSRAGRSPRASRRPGFTLVEVIATIAIISVIGSIASRTIITALNGYTTSATRAQLHSELSIAMDRIDRELKRIPQKASYGSIAPNITSVTGTSIAWNGNYSLSLSGPQLQMVDNGAATTVLLDNVTSFSIQAYNESNTALSATLSGTACDPIRRVVVQITIQRSGITETLRTKVFLRGTMRGAST